MNLKNYLIGDEDERAVSPVIGVILMVAITVILAAVIAAFVLDLGQSQGSSVNAGVSFSESSGDVTVQMTDSGNADYVNVTVSEGDFEESDCDGAESEADEWCNLDSVGHSVTIEDPDSITAIAVDGSNENVINNWP